MKTITRLAAVLTMMATATGAQAQGAASTTGNVPAAAGQDAAGQKSATTSDKGVGNDPSQIPNLLKNGMGNAQSPALPANAAPNNPRTTTNQ